MPTKMEVVADVLKFFKKGKGKKLLDKYGKNMISGLIYETLGGTDESGHSTQKTMDLVDELTASKPKKRLTKEEKEAAKAQKVLVDAAKERLYANGSYDKSTKDYIVQDILAPLLSGTASTLGNTVAAQQQIAPAIARAVAEKQAVDPRVAQGSLAAQMQSGVLNGMAAGSQAFANAKGTLATGIGNTVAKAADHAANVARNQDLSNRLNKRIQDEQLVNGNLPGAFYDLQNRELRTQMEGMQHASGGDW